jgi:nickel-dependent lactate racemase
VSNLKDGVVRDIMITPILTIEEGVERAFKVLGNEAEIAVIPEGPLVIPMVED